jgi:hypothetical protein
MSLIRNYGTLPALLVGIASLTHSALPQQVKDAADPDITGKFSAPTGGYDYVRREVMIPMRDGV